MNLNVLNNIRVGFFILFSLPGILLSQATHPILDSFTAIEAEGTVYISCVISSGNTCNGINVLKSTDQEQYSVIGNIAGVCGSSDNPVRYDFTDENPVVNSMNYYKLELGGQGFTPVIEVDYRVVEKNKVLTAPNPVISNVTFFFHNDSRDLMNIRIINSRSQIVLTFESNDSNVNMDLTFLSKGMYVVQVYNSSNGEMMFGKFLKL